MYYTTKLQFVKSCPRDYQSLDVPRFKLLYSRQNHIPTSLKRSIIPIVSSDSMPKAFIVEIILSVDSSTVSKPSATFLYTIAVLAISAESSIEYPHYCYSFLTQERDRSFLPISILLSLDYMYRSDHIFISFSEMSTICIIVTNYAVIVTGLFKLLKKSSSSSFIFL